jgi:Ca2+-binding RTX toxin-like protein
MATIIARSVAFDMRALSDVTEGFGVENGVVNQNATITIGGEQKPYSDLFRVELGSGGQLWFAGNNYAVNGSTSFNGSFDDGDMFTGGTVGALYSINSSNQILASIEGISLSAKSLNQAAATETGADDLGLVKTALRFNDTFDLSSKGDYVYGYDGNDLIHGNGGGDGLVGGNGNDTVYGDSGNDSLFGGDGRDKLYAGTGFDQLTGGAGRDQFYGGTDSSRDLFAFLKTSDSPDTDPEGDGLFDDVDVIWNFTRDTTDGVDDNDGDIIHLERIDTNSGQSGDQDFTWGGKDGAGARKVWWTNKDSDGDTLTGGILVMGDVTGNASAEFAIYVKGIGSIASDAFAGLTGVDTWDV